MALTIEDGNIIAGANSWATVAELRAFAAERGATTIPADDEDAEPLLVRAADYINSFEEQFRGDRVSEDQELSWPRANVVLHGFAVEETTIPTRLKKAQMQAAIEESKGHELLGVTDGQIVKREKVDVIETEFMTQQDLGGDVSLAPSYPAVDAMLAPLLKTGGVLVSVRV